MAAGAQELRGAGLGLRRALLDELQHTPDGTLDFLEAAPENWHAVGGRLGRRLAALLERFPVIWHGLSLDIGGSDPLDFELVDAVAGLLARSRCPVYSEHLSYCASDGHLYDLLPIPFTEEAVRHVAARVRAVQDRLGCRIALENSSYYAQTHRDLDESQFIGAVLEEADCLLLLDVNNVHVNSVNHGYDAVAFLRALPLQRVAYLHVAGHVDVAPDLKVDTHGTAVIDPVWTLLEQVYGLLGPVPTLLERDFNFPPFADLLSEIAMIRRLQDRVGPAGRLVGAACVG